MNISEHFNTFFRTLAIRQSNENDLSDFLWAVMEVVPKLKSDFCKYFSFDSSNDEPIEVQREEVISTGRPDFMVKSSKPELIVEVKLNDRDYHFDQYNSAFSGQGVKFGLLTNHRIGKDDYQKASHLGWITSAWEDFLKYISGNSYDEYQSVIDAFLEYAKKVCGVIEMSDIRFDAQSLYSLNVFVNIARKVIQSVDSTVFSCRVYDRQNRAFGETWTGIMYELVPTNEKDKKFWPYFGLVYEKPEIIRLCVALDNDWNRDLADKVRVLKNSADQIEIENYSGGDGVNLFLPGTEFDNFNTIELNEQETKLNEYFLRANQFLIQCLNHNWKNAYRDRNAPHRAALPHHRTYGSVYGGSAGQNKAGRK